MGVWHRGYSGGWHRGYSGGCGIRGIVGVWYNVCEK